MGTPLGPNTLNAKVPPSLLLKLAYDADADSLSLAGYAEIRRSPAAPLNAAGVIIQHDPFTGNVGVAYEDPVDGAYFVNLAFVHLDTLAFVYADDRYAVDRVATAGAALRDCRDSLFNSGLTGFSYLEPAAYVTGYELDPDNQQVLVRFRLYSRFERQLSIRVRFAVNPPSGAREPAVGWQTATGSPTSRLVADSSAPEYTFTHDLGEDIDISGPLSIQYEIWPYETPVQRLPCMDLLVDLYVQGRITGCNIGDDGIKVNGVGYATEVIEPGDCTVCDRLGGFTPGAAKVAALPISEALTAQLEVCNNIAGEVPDYLWAILNANEDDSSVEDWPAEKSGGAFNAGYVQDFTLIFEGAIRFDPTTLGGGVLTGDDYAWESNDAGVGVQLNTDPKPGSKKRSIIFEALTGARIGIGVAAGGAIVNTHRVWQGVHLLTVPDPINGDVVGIYTKSIADLVTPAALVPGSDTAFPSGFAPGDLVYAEADLSNDAIVFMNLMTNEMFATTIPALAVPWEWTFTDVVAAFGPNTRGRLLYVSPDSGITYEVDGGIHDRPLTVSAWLQPFERADEGVWPGGGFDPYPPNAVSDPLGIGFGINVWSNNGGGSALAVAGVGLDLKNHGGTEFLAGEEYFVAVVYDVDETRVYVDGQLLTTGPAFAGTDANYYLLNVGRHRESEHPWGFGPMRFVDIIAGPRLSAAVPTLAEINILDEVMNPIPAAPMTGPSAPAPQKVFGSQPDGWELYDDVGGTTSQLDAGENVTLDRGPEVTGNPRTIEVVPGGAPTAIPASIVVSGSRDGVRWFPIPAVETPITPALLPVLPNGVLGSRRIFQGRVRDVRIAQQAYPGEVVELLNSYGPAYLPTQAGLPPECLPPVFLDGALMWVQPFDQEEVLCEAWADPGEIVTFGDCTPDGKTVLGSSSCTPYVPFEVLTFGGIAISTRKFKGYTGPCCTVRKVSDPGGPTFDVGWNSEGWRDDDALEAWADGEATECVRVYSQAPDAEDLVIDANPACDGPFRVTDDDGLAYKTPDTGRPMFWTGVAAGAPYQIPPVVKYWMISENNLADNSDKMICAVATPYRPVEEGHGAFSSWGSKLCGMYSGVFAHQILFDAPDDGGNRAIEVEHHDRLDPRTIKAPRQWEVEQTLSVGYAAPVFSGGAFNLYRNGTAMPLVVQGNGGQWWPNRKMCVGAGQGGGGAWDGGVCEFVCVNGTYPNEAARDLTRNQAQAFGAIT